VSGTASPPQGSASTARRTGSRLRLRGSERSHTRIRNRGAWPTTTVLSFQLSRSARLVLAVRGPGPGCELAGRIRIAGHKGLNLFAFDGTIRNRPLEPGTYLLTTQEKGRTKDLARSYITVVARKSSKPTAPRPKCSSRATLASTPPSGSASQILGFPGAAFFAAREVSDETGVTSSGEARGSSQNGRGSRDAGGVLGELSPVSSGLPELPAIERPQGVSVFLAILLLALLLGSLLGVIVFEIHHLRQARVEALASKAR